MNVIFTIQRTFLCYIDSSYCERYLKLEKDLRDSRILPSRPIVSIIIPCYNEESTISSTLKSIHKQYDESEIEVIVSGGGSNDNTLLICRSAFPSTKLITEGRSRAQCMNLGANIAKVDVLFFLHADSVLPQGWKEGVIDTLNQPNTVLGAFYFKPNSPSLSRSFAMKIITWMTNFRSCVFSFPYGDQGLFIRRQHFFLLGGFPNVPFMEDYEFVDQIRKLHGNSVRLVSLRSLTSARRWEENGVILNTLQNQCIIWARTFGISHSTLFTWYNTLFAYLSL